MNTIVEKLSESLGKLTPGLISCKKKHKLVSHLSDAERKEVRRRLPYMPVKCKNFDQELRIAEPYPSFDSDDEEAELVPTGFWNIKAKLRTYN